MQAYDWDLMERLLHEAQQSTGKTFAPRTYAKELASELDLAGRPVANLDTFEADAARYEEALVQGGFIQNKPMSDGGTGFNLTDRGLQLLSMVDHSIPGTERPRAILDEAGTAALVPEVFDDLAPRASLYSPAN